MSTWSTHVLDSVLGRPAAGVAFSFAAADGTVLAEGVTDADGRFRGAEAIGAGVHRLTFATGAWFAAQGRAALHPEITVAVEVADDEHHHLALLLGPFSYTTYRGS